MTKRIILNIILTLFTSATFAQSAQWAVAPVYKSVERLSPTVFKITNATNKVGATTAEGEIVIDTIADAVTLSPNGYACAVNKEKKRMQLLAVIDESGKAINLSEELYTDALPRFASGRLLAKNKKNKYGYLTTDGSFTVSDEAANEAKALSKGKGKKNGQDAVAVDMATDGPEVFVEEKGKQKRYGYKNGETVVLPPQFLSAEPFSGGYAVARTESGVGVLKLTPKPFVCTQTSAVMDAGMENTVFTSTIPENAEAVLRMKCVDSTGMTFDCEGQKKGDNIHFELSSFKERRTFSVIATDTKGTLVLWSSNFDNKEEAKEKQKTKTKTKTKSKKKGRK